MNAFTIYLVMQMDSIGNMLAFLTAILFVWMIFELLGALANRAIYRDYPSVSEKERVASESGFKKVKVLTLLWVPLLLLATLLPSSRTLAAMLILPSIANNETIQREAGELYELAKEALRKAGDNK